MRMNTRVKKNLVSFAAGLLAAGASAQSLQFLNVSSGIYCRFDPNCNAPATTQSDTFSPTNVAATCVLESRSFPGNSLDSQGTYGYEYCITLNNNGATGTNFVTINSLALDFGEPVIFNFGQHASNQVWLITEGGPDGLPPASADMGDTNITFQFNPPLTLETDTGQTTNTCYFGMISSNAPQTATIILKGSAQDPVFGNVPFEAKVQALTPTINP